MSTPFETVDLPPVDPDFRDRVERRHARDALCTDLGIEIADIAPGRVCLTMAASDRACDPDGRFRTAAVFAIAEAAATLAAVSLAPPSAIVTTSDAKLSIAQTPAGAQLVADAAVLRAGRSVQVLRVKVGSASAGRDTRETCAVLQATCLLTSG